MRKIIVCLLILGILTLLAGCDVSETAKSEDAFQITDVNGKECTLTSDSRVVSCYASYAECWMLAGGQLVGVTEDAIEEHGLDVGDAEIIGTVKHIDLEKVVSLEPDYVILSADLTAHLSLQDSLDDMHIPYGYFRVDVFDDYKNLMAQFCEITQRPDLYEAHVQNVEKEIAQTKEMIPETDSEVLLLRAFSTGMKAKSDDNLAGQILKEFGLKNIADDDSSLLEDISLEKIIQADPDYIFVMTMGDEEGAKAYLDNYALGHPAWNGLTAVKNEKYYLLPKELFHYKPNNRWSESYEYLAKIIWPEIFEG